MIWKNKKGGEKYLSMWWFLVLVVIAGSIVIAVSALNSIEIETKKLEANILTTKIADCLVKEGYINENFLKNNFDIFENCSLNKKLIEENKQQRGNYYLKIEIYKFENCSILKEKVECKEPLIKKEFGVINFENECKIKEKTKAKNHPSCNEEYIYVLNKKNEKLILHIIAGSNQITEK